ncbi:MAG: hypothetical protein QM820_15970 [Minicystis sp.]
MRLANEQGSLEGKTRRLPLLDDIRIASPCDASWEDMTGDGRVRFCGSCQKHVYNIIAMTRGEAESLLAAHEGEGSICLRLYQRADGTVITADCPEGVRRRRRRRRVLAVASAGAMAATAALAAAAPRMLETRPVMTGAASTVETPIVATGAVSTAETPPETAATGSPTTTPRTLPPDVRVTGGAVPLRPHMGKPVSVPSHKMGKIAAPID